MSEQPAGTDPIAEERDAEDQQVIDVLRGQMPHGSTILSPLDVLNLLQEELGQARKALQKEAERIAKLEALVEAHTVLGKNGNGAKEKEITP